MENFFEITTIIIFLTVVLLHIEKKNSLVILLYFIQAAAVTGVLVWSALGARSTSLLAVALVTFVIKAIIAPWFFTNLIKKNNLTFSASTYLSLPLTLISVAILTSFAYSSVFAPLSLIAPSNAKIITLSLAVMLISFFLIINRKGVLSQMVGILSLENSIVLFAVFAGLEETPALQLGIVFDISIWIVIATVFASMIYRQFGSLDVTTMQSLKE